MNSMPRSNRMPQMRYGYTAGIARLVRVELFVIIRRGCGPPG